MKVRWLFIAPVACVLGALWAPYLSGRAKPFNYDLFCAASHDTTGYCDEARPGRAAGALGTILLAGLAVGLMLDAKR